MTDMKTFRFSGYVGYDGITSEAVNAALNTAAGEDIEVHLNTQGGNIYQGIEVFNIINSYKGHKTVILGALVASIGTYIACAFDTVIAQDLTIYMVHNASNGVWGDYRTLRKEADELERLNKHLADRYARFTKKPVEEMLALMAEETWKYGKEILEAGFATEYRETGTSAGKENVLTFAKRTYKNSMDRVAAFSGTPPQKGDDPMDKQTLITEAKALLAKGELNAGELGISDTSKAELEAAKAELTTLKAEKAKADTEKALDDAFGKEGMLRSYASTLASTGKSVEDIRKDPLAIHLAGQKAAGVTTTETNKPDDNKTVDGIKVVRV